MFALMLGSWGRLLSAMGKRDINKERLELALEAAGLDLWENDLVTGDVTHKATKIFAELGYSEDEGLPMNLKLSVVFA
jgi:hypothetical protein